MAIAYKSAGAGVSTETSGAALSPACPATVDSGDILIAHVFWEGTTTAPSTPSGWTMLGSSPYVIETTVARHWVFGKIADGTEDGATVAFGSPAVTTQRAARIYSFSGRTAGTIDELVPSSSFSHQSHGTDPQMPTVTTTEAGNLAVALMAQNDNNTSGNATGESGGDWTEAVAEYVAALTPGLQLQLQTCTPTANPGTVSGGSVATTNDPCGVIGFQIRAAAAQTVSPGVGAVTGTGFAPTVTATANQTVTPSLGEVTATGFAPTVTVNVIVTADLGALTATGFEPSVSVSDNRTASSSTGELTATGFEPVVSVTANAQADPALGELAATGFAPTVTATDNQTISADVGALTATGFAPTVTATANATASIGIGELVVSGYAPDVQVTGGAPDASGGVYVVRARQIGRR